MEVDTQPYALSKKSKLKVTDDMYTRSPVRTSEAVIRPRLAGRFAAPLDRVG